MDIVHQLNIQAPANRVYKAFATEAGIQGWWSSNSEVGESQGAVVLLKFAKGDNIVKMNFEVTEVAPGHKVVWTCTENTNPAWIGTSLSFEVLKQEEFSVFTLAHTGFDGKWAEQPPYTMTVEGWLPFIDSFQSYCESGVGQPAG